MTIAASGTHMTVRALLFAQLRGRFEANELRVPLPARSTGRDLMQWFAQRNSKVEDLLSVSRLAVNGEYVSLEQVLKDGDEIVIIPPVSGG